MAGQLFTSVAMVVVATVGVPGLGTVGQPTGAAGPVVPVVAAFSSPTPATVSRSVLVDSGSGVPAVVREGLTQNGGNNGNATPGTNIQIPGWLSELLNKVGNWINGVFTQLFPGAMA